MAAGAIRDSRRLPQRAGVSPIRLRTARSTRWFGTWRSTDLPVATGMMNMGWGSGPTGNEDMLKIVCPNCGERHYTEFRYAGDATKTRPAHGSGDLRTWHDHVFL